MAKKKETVGKMTYSVAINTEAAKELDPDGDVLDIKDLVIIHYIEQWLRSDKRKRVTVEGKAGVWLDYETLTTRLPYLRIKTVDGIKKRIAKLKEKRVRIGKDQKTDVLWTKLVPRGPGRGSELHVALDEAFEDVYFSDKRQPKLYLYFDRADDFKLRGSDIDVTDLLIVGYIARKALFTSSKNVIKKKTSSGKRRRFRPVSYRELLDELPILGFKDKGSLIARLGKLERLRVIEKLTRNVRGNQRAYFRFRQRFKNIYFNREKQTYEILTRGATKKIINEMAGVIRRYRLKRPDDLLDFLESCFSVIKQVLEYNGMEKHAASVSLYGYGHVKDTQRIVRFIHKILLAKHGLLVDQETEKWELKPQKIELSQLEQWLEDYTELFCKEYKDWSIKRKNLKPSSQLLLFGGRLLKRAQQGETLDY